MTRFWVVVQFETLRGLAQPRHFPEQARTGCPTRGGSHGWAAMPMGSGDFADVKLRFLGLIDQNRAAFAIGVMPEAAP